MSMMDFEAIYQEQLTKNARMSFDDLKDIYTEQLKSNPKACEEVSNFFIVPKLMFWANDNGSEHMANLAWLSNLDPQNAILRDGSFRDIVRKRWSEAVNHMLEDEQFNRWAPDLAEIQDALATEYSLYESLRLLIPIVSEWEWDSKTFTARLEMRPINDAVRDKLLSVLREMRNQEQFRLFFIDLDEMITQLREENMLVYGLIRIKDGTDD